MTTLLFLYALISTPQDRIVCDLWTRAITQASMLQACGSLRVSGYRVDVYTLEMNLLCTQNAEELANIVTVCGLDKPLDEYVIRIVEPKYTGIICYVTSTQSEAPTYNEIVDQCDGLSEEYTLEFVRQLAAKEEPEPFACPVRAIASGSGLYQQVSSPAGLMTDESLTWLAGKLIWNGLAAPVCDGSGLDPYTLAADACGMATTRRTVIQWQNQFDTEIYNAATTYHVPAKLLKRMIRIESQFWPFYAGGAGETGIMQITDNGLDTLLRFDTAIDPGYLSRDERSQLWSRAVTRNLFTCTNCNLSEAIAHIKNTMPMYARTLAAFHCRAVTINPALFGDLAWRQAVVDYNGDSSYLERIEK